MIVVVLIVSVTVIIITVNTIGFKPKLLNSVRCVLLNSFVTLLSGSVVAYKFLVARFFPLYQ